MDDKTLISECVKGNAKAQKLLFEKFAPKMMSVCLRYFRDVEEAEDALQDGFIKVFNKLPDFKMEGSLEGWIRRVIVNTSLDTLRKNKHYKNDVQLDDVDFKIANIDSAMDKLMAEDLMKLIHRLPEGYRLVFNLFAIEGYSHKEIADLLEINENTSKSQYSRAKAFLRTEIEKLGIER
jgi:RNA polymerase sigma factor (sigma-70 family)